MYREHILESMAAAENLQSKITPEILAIDGMSGAKTRHFYNNVLSKEGMRYLEVGVYKGSSTCAAMCGNKNTVVAIDNWSEFGGPKNIFLQNFNKFKGENDATFLEQNCFQVDTAALVEKLGGKKFNVYMYDGPHQQDQHCKALTHFIPCLEDTFIYIVDDWNWQGVRHGTKKGIEDNKLKIEFETEIRSTFDNSVPPKKEREENWWNGIYIAILSKP